jgi:sodium transport system permease protein
MMRWSIVRTIWFREVRDQLRDRRTILMLLVVPLILYPGIGVTMGYLLTLFAEQPITIGVAGAELLQEHSPATADRYRLKALPPLLEGDHFAENLSSKPEASKPLRVVRGSETELEARLKRGEIQAYLVFSPEFVEDLRRGQKAPLQVKLRGEEPPDDAPPSTPDKPRTLVTTNDRSQLAFDRLRPVLLAWRQEIVKSRMRLLQAPNEQYSDPFQLPRLSLKAERAASRIFPFLIVMMSLTGALYPAIDVCAGEKERGTMETLLISPASRAEIVTGKFLTVWLFSTVSALLNLASLGFTAWQFSSSGAAYTGGELALPLPGPTALAWGFVLLLPLAAFFSAVCVALAVYARSTKEGQYYLMPLTIVTLLLTFASLMPGTELTAFYSLIPITGASLLLQELMNARSADQVPWLYLGPVLLPLAVYCYLALQWAVHQFNREDVLFREAERLDLGLWVRRLLREKEPLPTPGEAMVCFVLILLLRWFISINTPPERLLQGSAVLQIAGIAMPALLMAILLTSRPLLTLRLLWPRLPLVKGPGAGVRLVALLGWTALAIVLALAAHGPLLAILKAVAERFPQLLEHFEELGKRLIGDLPLWQLLLLFALLPAVCEELAFRGFILNGLATRLGGGSAILVSSLLFAFAHGDAFRVLPTFPLGVILALLATRSGSLYPGMLFHAIHNGLALSVGWWSKQVEEGRVEPSWLLSDQGIYDLRAVIGSAALLLVLICLLLCWPPVRPQSVADNSET